MLPAGRSEPDLPEAVRLANAIRAGHLLQHAVHYCYKRKEWEEEEEEADSSGGSKFIIPYVNILP
jgi:hypothetical protein